MTRAAHAASPPQKRIEHRHTHRDPHLDLFGDDRLHAIGNGGIDLDTAIHRAGMHDERVGLGQGQLLAVEAIEAIVFAYRGDQTSVSAFVLQAQHHHHVDIAYAFLEIGEDFGCQLLDAGWQQGLAAR